VVRKLTGLVCLLVLLVTWAQSLSWYRLKLIEKDFRLGEYRQLDLYRRIFRKQHVLGIPRADSAMLAQQMTTVYKRVAKMKLNQAQVTLEYMDPDLELFDKIIREFQTIRDFDARYRQSLQFLNMVVDNEWEDIVLQEKKARQQACLKYGNQLVLSGNLDLARDFFTRQILSYLTPAEALVLVHGAYGQPGSASVRRKIWGDDIFVVLEDFEKLERPIFYNWSSTQKVYAKTHAISKAKSRSGQRSEYFAVDYPRCGGTLWVRDVDIALSEGIPFGVRFYVHGQDSVNTQIGVGLWYSREKVSEPIVVNNRIPVSGGWQKLWVEDLFSEAMKCVKQSGKSKDNLIINRIILTTNCKTGPFYVDDVELYWSKN